MEGGRARLRRVLVGHRTPEIFEVKDGLAVGSEVICYPPNDLTEGAHVRPRRRSNL